mmetsp:Transcript_38858/g.90384  ORF Transcript_38858/g.90384 Transcript_38858/m.90384 type:complete len:174 (-) Transcript_38858:3149-3670(-)
MMLEKVEEEGKTDIVSWSPNGRFFMVHNIKKFVSEIMQSHFKQTKISSFQRQLNLYGFRRINGGYFHEFFIRGLPGLCVGIFRIKVKPISSYESEQAKSNDPLNLLPVISHKSTDNSIIPSDPPLSLSEDLFSKSKQKIIPQERQSDSINITTSDRDCNELFDLFYSDQNEES